MSPHVQTEYHKHFCENLLRHRRNCRQRLRQWLSYASVTLLGVASTVGLTSGCNRAQHRTKTNREAYHLIDEKICESGENTLPYRIEVDPRSRLFDPFNPDRPPMPEDDPVANQYMKMVDNKRGYPLWEANGRTNTAENPQWWSYLPLDERGVLVLNMENAARLAFLHSAPYQQNKETLFLSALDVSSERFLLDSQFFGGYSASYTSDGRRRNNGNNSSSVLALAPFSAGRRPLSMQRSFATGADLIVGFANNLTWQLSGPNNQSATTLLDFSLIQPLLRQAGRDVVLERLTLAERTLLANVRAFERYRRGFYLNVTTGRPNDQGPQRRGGVFGGAGLSGFTGLGGGFGQVTGGGGGGNAGFANTAAPGAGGFLGLLQNQLEINNTYENIARQRDVLLQFEDTYRELLLTIPTSQTVLPSQQIQVEQTRQQLYTQTTGLINLQSQYESTLDTYKQTLGLPSYLCVEIQDPLLERFKLVSPELLERRNQLSVLRDGVGQANTQLLEQSSMQRDPRTGESFRAIASGTQLIESLKTLQENMSPISEVYEKLVELDVPQVKADIERLRSTLPERAKQLARLRDLVQREKDLVCRLLPMDAFDLSLLDEQAVARLPDDLLAELDKLVTKFTDSAKAVTSLNAEVGKLATESNRADNDRKRFEAISSGAMLKSQDLIAKASEDLLALQLIQARARTETATLPEIDIEPREALEIARRNRHDWLNNRAALVNSWRAIEVVADDLESTLDLTFSGDVQNIGDNPLALRSATGRLRVGLQWDAPITRLQERNRYRQALIEYQQAKRSYYQFEDAVWRSLRTELRSIRVNQFVFEIQRFALRNAAQQISINEDLRQINEALGTPNPTAARDASGALLALLEAQNVFIGTWVNYEAIRRALDQDMGTLQIDAEGLWVDPGAIRADTVGGQLGQAILNYGLSEGEQAIAQQLNAPGGTPAQVEVAPSNLVPAGNPSSNAPAVPAPVNPAQVAPGADFQGSLVGPQGPIAQVSYPAPQNIVPKVQPNRYANPLLK